MVRATEDVAHTERSARAEDAARRFAEDEVLEDDDLRRRHRGVALMLAEREVQGAALGKRPGA